MSEKQNLLKKIKEVTGWSIPASRMEIYSDTSGWMNIYGGCVIRLDCNDFIVRGNMSETRFGINEQPKLWVFSAIDLDSKKEKIIKACFYEEFYAHISKFKIRCYRSPEKEADVLDLTFGDDRFMQGFTCKDDSDNKVRVIDYIRGDNFFDYIPGIEKDHKRYFIEDLPEILWKLKDSIEAIKLLHDNKLCHGDIRNDHIIIDKHTKKFRWIDFDLNQDVSDFDLWSLGNILAYAVAKGIKTFSGVNKDKNFPAHIKENLRQEDCSAFYEYRIMNLKKIYPYLPYRLSKILQHFTIKPVEFYNSIDELLDDYNEMLENEFPLK